MTAKKYNHTLYNYILKWTVCLVFFLYSFLKSDCTLDPVCVSILFCIHATFILKVCVGGGTSVSTSHWIIDQQLPPDRVVFFLDFSLTQQLCNKLP